MIGEEDALMLVHVAPTIVEKAIAFVNAPRGRHPHLERRGEGCRGACALQPRVFKLRLRRPDLRALLGAVCHVAAAHVESKLSSNTSAFLGRTPGL